MLAKALIIAGVGSFVLFSQREVRHRWSHSTPAYAFVATTPTVAGGESEIRSFDPLTGRCMASIERYYSLESNLLVLSSEEVRISIESALSKAGIPIGADDCTKSTMQQPPHSLRLRLDVAKVEKDSHAAYLVTLRVMETMARQSIYRTERKVTAMDVPIWRCEELAIVNSADAASDIRTSIARVADEFCQAFLKANQP